MTASMKEMDAATLKQFFEGGCAFLGTNKEMVNALNVFPVPDGDTGINMFLTINSAIKNVKNTATVGEVAADFALGALMGARGNSGVILSQIFRGFSQSVAGKNTISAIELAAALQKGVDLSYKSVMKPVEGTILTVYRQFAAAAVNEAGKSGDIAKTINAALSAGEDALQHTPDFLPVLREAGVVDAGGKGLLTIMEGGIRSLRGEVLAAVSGQAAQQAMDKATSAAAQAAADFEFVYCTELLIKGSNINTEKIRSYLSNKIEGDSLVVVGTPEVVKIHFHNNMPWQVLTYAAGFGSLHDIKIENMRDQHHELSASISACEADEPDDETPQIIEEPCRCSVIAVCAGDGLTQILDSMGAVVIKGGQTMNPSAEELLEAISQCGGEEVVILPNNSNIILTARQVVDLADRPVHVVESKFITQGISAMLCFDRDNSGADNAAAMSEAITAVVSGELTYAVRDSSYNGFTIKKDDLLGLKNDKIVVVGQQLEQTLLELIEKMIDNNENYGLISLFYGNNQTEEDVAPLVEAVKAKYPGFDVECYLGGQPLYYFLLSVE